MNIDSSVLIEYIKGTKTELLEAIVNKDINLKPYINHIVYSEFLFHFLALTAHKSPLSLKKSSTIQSILTNHEPIDFIRNFSIVEMNQRIIEFSYDMMKNYNLLPNDALILASCRYHKIPYLATYDSDFNDICEQEDIALICKAEDVKNYRKPEP